MVISQSPELSENWGSFPRGIYRFVCLGLFGDGLAFRGELGAGRARCGDRIPLALANDGTMGTMGTGTMGTGNDGDSLICAVFLDF
jgi:hypothetical protein